MGNKNIVNVRHPRNQDHSQTLQNSRRVRPLRSSWESQEQGVSPSDLSPSTSFNVVTRRSLRGDAFSSGLHRIDVQESSESRTHVRVVPVSFPQSDEELREHFFLMEMQIEGLFQLNAQSNAQLERLFNPNAVVTEGNERDGQIIELLNETHVRDQEIEERQQLMAMVSAELRARGVSLHRTGVETAYAETAEDSESLCIYCVAHPIDTVYMCCNHRGACAECAATLRVYNHRCPHCRAPEPTVRRIVKEPKRA